MFESGDGPFAEALVGSGWPAGQPSPNVRGAFNAVRTYLAVSELTSIGQATEDEVIEALIAAGDATATASGSDPFE